jgi:cholera toxin transcriptional activator
MNTQPTMRKRFGIYEAHLGSGELFKNGQKIRMQEQPFQVLVALLDRPGEVVTRDELQQRLWPSDTFVDFDHSLNTCINKLRDALGDTANNPRFIETLPRRGYRFIAPVQDVEAIAVPQPVSAQEAAVSVPPAISDYPEMAVTLPMEDVRDGATREATLPNAHDLPQASRRLSRTLFGLLQLMYLIFYSVALWRLEEIGARADASWMLPGGPLESVVLVTAVIGIPLRLYTLNATLFDYAKLGRNFQRLFLLVLPLDILWALSPFLLLPYLGVGLAFGACAALVYSPFAQRVLALMTWGKNG